MSTLPASRAEGKMSAMLGHGLLDLKLNTAKVDGSPMQFDANIIQGIADGFVDKDRGRGLRATVLAYFHDLESELAPPVRSEIARLLTQLLARAHGVGTGVVSPKANAEVWRSEHSK